MANPRGASGIVVHYLARLAHCESFGSLAVSGVAVAVAVSLRLGKGTSARSVDSCPWLYDSLPVCLSACYNASSSPQLAGIPLEQACASGVLSSYAPSRSLSASLRVAGWLADWFFLSRSAWLTSSSSVETGSDGSSQTKSASCG